jgi:hypothetical protein
MTTQRQRTGNRLAPQEQSPTAGNLPARKFPVQREIRKLEEELHAFNERIAEDWLKTHRGPEDAAEQRRLRAALMALRRVFRRFFVPYQATS